MTDRESIYPLTEPTLVRYFRYLDDVKLCGPSVPEATLAAFSWVANKVGFEAAVASEFVHDIVHKVKTERSKPLKQAKMPPLKVLLRFEQLVLADDTDPILAVFYGWVLIVVWVSLRGDDLTRASPGSLGCEAGPGTLEQYEGGAVFGYSDQTKTTLGMHFAIPNVSLTPGDKGDWLARWVRRFLKELKALHRDRYAEEMKRDHLLELPSVDRKGRASWCKGVAFRSKDGNALPDAPCDLRHDDR